MCGGIGQVCVFCFLTHLADLFCFSFVYGFLRTPVKLPILFIQLTPFPPTFSSVLAVKFRSDQGMFPFLNLPHFIFYMPCSYSPLCTPLQHSPPLTFSSLSTLSSFPKHHRMCAYRTDIHLQTQLQASTLCS